MLWLWLFQMVIWLVKLPFYLLPNATFMPLPTQVTGAIQTLGGYTSWIFYLLGDTAGDAFTLVITWAIPLMITVWLWKIFSSLAHKIIFGLFGKGGSATLK